MEKRSNWHVRGRRSRSRRNRRRNVAAFASASTLTAAELVFVSALAMVVLAGFVASALAVIAGTGRRRILLRDGCRTESFEAQHVGDESGLLHHPVVVGARDEQLIGCRCCCCYCWDCCGRAGNLLCVPD